MLWFYGKSVVFGTLCSVLISKGTFGGLCGGWLKMVVLILGGNNNVNFAGNYAVKL